MRRFEFVINTFVAKLEQFAESYSMLYAATAQGLRVVYFAQAEQFTAVQQHAEALQLQVMVCCAVHITGCANRRAGGGV